MDPARPDPDRNGRGLNRSDGLKLTVYHDKCIASGNCVLACPEVFGQDELGMVVVLDPDPPEALREQVLEAAAACPASVIEAE